MNPEIGCTTKYPTSDDSHQLTYSDSSHILVIYLAYVNRISSDILLNVLSLVLADIFSGILSDILNMLKHHGTCCFHIKLVIKPLDTQYVIIPVGEIPPFSEKIHQPQGTTLTSYVKSSKLGRLAHMKCV